MSPECMIFPTYVCGVCGLKTKGPMINFQRRTFCGPEKDFPPSARGRGIFAGERLDEWNFSRQKTYNVWSRQKLPSSYLHNYNKLVYLISQPVCLSRVHLIATLYTQRKPLLESQIQLRFIGVVKVLKWHITQ